MTAISAVASQAPSETMQGAVLRIQWKAAWHLVLALSLTAFALPIVSVQLAWRDAAANLPLFLTELQLWGFFYPLLAVVIAIIVAAAVWMSDRRGQHVYSLLLPVPRWRYVLMRYVASLAMLAPVLMGMWLGALVAVNTLSLPPGLRVFPNALAVKFGFAVLVLFGLAFLFASSSARTIGIGVRIVGLFLLLHITLLLISPSTNLLLITLRALAVFPGPLSPLAGHWMLIDA